MICGILRYVIHERVEDYLRCGWMFVASLGPTHGEWSILMGWPCRCKPAEPRHDPR
jgi:hypothetical protein